MSERVSNEPAARPECTCRERVYFEGELEKLRAIVGMTDATNDRLHDALEAARARVAVLEEALREAYKVMACEPDVIDEDDHATWRKWQREVLVKIVDTLAGPLRLTPPPAPGPGR